MVGDLGRAESCFYRHRVRACVPASWGRAGRGTSAWVPAPWAAIGGDQTAAIICSSRGAKGAAGLVRS